RRNLPRLRDRSGLRFDHGERVELWNRHVNLSVRGVVPRLLNRLADVRGRDDLARRGVNRQHQARIRGACEEKTRAGGVVEEVDLLGRGLDVWKKRSI